MGEGQGYSADEALRRSGPVARGGRLLGGFLFAAFALVVGVVVVGADVVIVWWSFETATWLGLLVLVGSAVAGVYARARVLAPGPPGTEARPPR
ncbi:hypothetical protein ACFRAR_24735 [Kitasatospora sp. NPDC056651]|uniref:hypothetical protein n=1 Tax=Kitasatospora sp. NPDC056651 TaxID=3345892 RepID=UPI00368A1BE8